ncbi:hypothetical protein GCM10027403_21820 [Arthrobacter tecti]
MFAATYAGQKTINIAELKAEAPGPGMVQIEVAYTGLCGTADSGGRCNTRWLAGYE